MDQRREDLDVGAHDDDVARLQRRVVGEQVEDRVAHDLDLAGTAVAGVHLQASIVRLQQHALVVGARERQARRACGRRECRPGFGRAASAAASSTTTVVVNDDVVAVAREDELHLASVLPPGGEQRILRQRRGRVLGAAHDRRQVAR